VRYAASAVALVLAAVGSGCSASGIETDSASVSARKAKAPGATAPMTLAVIPVYLNDPGLTGLSQRPEYITLPVRRQTLEWVRNLTWQTWGTDIARGRGTWERCTFGRCKRAATQVTLSQRLPRDCSTGSSYTRITFTTPAGRRTVIADRYICEDD
jgi:hypothetical protein